jgi:hypothetical protein
MGTTAIHAATVILVMERAFVLSQFSFDDAIGAKPQ